MSSKKHAKKGIESLGLCTKSDGYHSDIHRRIGYQRKTQADSLVFVQSQSLETQIKIHQEKLKKARERGDIGLASYYEKEIEHFERAKEKLMRRIIPKPKRKK